MTAIVSTDVDARIAEVMKEIFEAIPSRLNINAIMNQACADLTRAAGSTAPSNLIADKLVEVLREIATYTVEQFTGRTGQPFQWVDDASEMNEPEPLMSFGLDDKGNLIFK